MNNEPLAFFVTWTVYGTFLQGDSRWWRKDGNLKPPQPLLRQWHQNRLKHDIVLLVEPHRLTVKTEIQRHCIHRGWKLWAVNPRTNHVHSVVSASNYSGAAVRDQLKANATRGLRQQFVIFNDRPIWTVGGDWQCINTEDELDRVVRYSVEAQDKMEDK